MDKRKIRNEGLWQCSQSVGRLSQIVIAGYLIYYIQFRMMSEELSPQIFNLKEIEFQSANNQMSLFHEGSQFNSCPFFKKDWMNEDDKPQIYVTTAYRTKNPFAQNYDQIEQNDSDYPKNNQSEKDVLISRESGSFKRKPKIIQTSISAKQKRHYCRKGDSLQTKNLSKHLYTITSNHLKMLISISELNQEQKQVVHAFLKRKKEINLTTFKPLFDLRQLRQKIQRYFQSSVFVAEFMNSRAELKNKAIFIKYLDKIRGFCFQGAQFRWKDWKESKD